MPWQRDAYEGIWVPLVTPFCDERLDTAPLEGLVDWLLEAGIRGVVALGTTGEAPHLTDDEAEEFVRAVVACVRGRVPVLAGAGRASVAATVACCKRLHTAGADAALVLTPSYYRTQATPEFLAHYYDAVAEHSPLPVFVYHMPGVSGLQFDGSALCRTALHRNVWGFKDSSRQDGPLAAALAMRPDLRGFAGSAARLLEGLEHGAAGGILALGQAIPESSVALYRAWRSGDLTTAQHLQQQLSALGRELAGWEVTGIKYALALRGHAVGDARAPLLPLPDDVRRRIATALRNIQEDDR